jgi:hypothetical protein
VLIDEPNPYEQEDSSAVPTLIYLFNLALKTYKKIELKWKECNDVYGAEPLLIINDLYMIGGYDPNCCCCCSNELSIFYKISLRDTTMHYLSESSSSKSKIGVCHFRGEYIYALCGEFNNSRMDTCEKYNVEIDAWYDMPHANEAKDSVGCTVIGSSLYMFGGHTKLGFVDTIEKISAIDSIKWIKLQLQSTPFIKQLINIFPLHVGDSNVIIAGEDASGNTYSYMADIKKLKYLSTIKLPKGKIMSAMQGLDYVAFINNTNLTKVSSQGTILETISVQNIKKNWKCSNYKIEAEGDRKCIEE